MSKKIYHIAENISLESGGLRSMISSLNDYTNSQDLSSEILTLKKESFDLEKEIPFRKNPWFYSKYYKDILENLNPKESVFHLHGVFFYPQYIANKIAYKKNIPDIITSHGMLSNYFMGKRDFKKSIYKNLVLNNLLKKAKVLHAITENEKNVLYDLSNNKNIIEIPNLIHINSNLQVDYKPEEEYILYLGRFHEVKGIDLLVKAFEEANPSNLKLYLVGFKNDYSNVIQKYISSRNLTNKVYIKDALLGKEKNDILKNAKALICPSSSEVIGMVNLEAASLKTPVVTTFNTGLKKDWDRNGGMLINPNLQELKKTIQEINNWSLKERIENGENLFKFVEQEYSWEKKGRLWIELYNSL